MTNTARPGIIETLSSGFAVVHRRPWLISFPVLLDLAFWQGPRVSAAPVIDELFARYEQMSVSNPDLASVAVEGSGDTLTVVQEISVSLAQGNLLHLLAWQVPSLASVPMGETARPLFEISSFPAAFLVALLFVVIGLLGTSVYLAAIALAVRETGFSLPQYVQNVLSGWRRLVGYYALALAAGIPIVFVSLVITGLAGLFGALVLSLTTRLAGALVFLAWLYLGFVDEAIFVSDVGVRGAVRLSVGVVVRFFWSAIALLFLSNTIAFGLTIVWLRIFDVHPVAGVIAILGHAYIASGLAATAMFFYRNRTTYPSAAQRLQGVTA